MSELTVTQDNFEKEVLQSPVPVLIDFWAPWCGPCRMVAPIVEKLAKAYDGKLKVGRVNVDEEPELASKFSISSIPTLTLFKDGKVVSQRVGAVPYGVLESFVSEYI